MDKSYLIEMIVDCMKDMARRTWDDREANAKGETIVNMIENAHKEKIEKLEAALRVQKEAFDLEAKAYEKMKKHAEGMKESNKKLRLIIQGNDATINELGEAAGDRQAEARRLDRVFRIECDRANNAEAERDRFKEERDAALAANKGHYGTKLTRVQELENTLAAFKEENGKSRCIRHDTHPKGLDMCLKCRDEAQTQLKAQLAAQGELVGWAGLIKYSNQPGYFIARQGTVYESEAVVEEKCVGEAVPIQIRLSAPDQPPQGDEGLVEELLALFDIYLGKYAKVNGRDAAVRIISKCQFPLLAKIAKLEAELESFAAEFCEEIRHDEYGNKYCALKKAAQSIFDDPVRWKERAESAEARIKELEAGISDAWAQVFNRLPKGREELCEENLDTLICALNEQLVAERDALKSQVAQEGEEFVLVYEWSSRGPLIKSPLVPVDEYADSGEWQSLIVHLPSKPKDVLHELHDALRCLYDDTADYIRVNNLGDINHNISMQKARDALRLLEKEKPGADACVGCGLVKEGKIV